MKYIVLLCDGMADRAVPALNGQTPMQVAHKPMMDTLFLSSEMGLAKTVPDGMSPGSDVANLCVFGYNPAKYYTGRSPLEAVSMRLPMLNDDIALRVNLVTLSDASDLQDAVMLDYSAGEISTEEAGVLMRDIAAHLNREGLGFHAGISYRHCLIWNKGPMTIRLTPPHDISGRAIRDYLPKGPHADMVMAWIDESRILLKNHPVNLARISAGKNPATSIWLWGQGTKPILSSFTQRTGLKGAVISAVDLIKGIGLAAGMDIIEVPGATGNIHTNFRGKGEAALYTLLASADYIYIHVEAPDECGHQGQVAEKVLSIEKIDAEILKPLVEGLTGKEDFRILILPDHPTPLDIRTHTSDSVPWLLYDSRYPALRRNDVRFHEDSVQTGETLNEGYLLLDKLLDRKLQE